MNKHASDISRLFDMYVAHYLMYNSRDAENQRKARSIFLSEASYFREIFIEVLSILLEEQLYALAEVLRYELASMSPMEYIEHPTLPTLVESLPFPSAKLEKEFFAREPEGEEHSAQVWRAVLRQFFSDLADFIEWAVAVPNTAAIIHLFRVLDFNDKPWVRIAQIFERLHNVRGESAFILIDTLFDEIHHRGNLLNYFGQVLPWVSESVLTLKSSSSIKDLARFCSPDVQKLIKSESSLGDLQ